MQRRPKGPTPVPTRRRRRIVVVPKEAAEQQLLAAWLNLRGVLWCHVPNGEWRHWNIAKKLKAVGVMPGVPDILVFSPPPREVARGVAIELKRVGVRRCSADQARWLEALGHAGWLTKVASGAHEAVEWLMCLGY
jgi:hypothetical protein